MVVGEICGKCKKGRLTWATRHPDGLECDKCLEWYPPVQ